MWTVCKWDVKSMSPGIGFKWLSSPMSLKFSWSRLTLFEIIADLVIPHNLQNFSYVGMNFFLELFDFKPLFYPCTVALILRTEYACVTFWSGRVLLKMLFQILQKSQHYFCLSRFINLNSVSVSLEKKQKQKIFSCQSYIPDMFGLEERISFFWKREWVFSIPASIKYSGK